MASFFSKTYWVIKYHRDDVKKCIATIKNLPGDVQLSFRRDLRTEIAAVKAVVAQHAHPNMSGEEIGSLMQELVALSLQATAKRHRQVELASRLNTPDPGAVPAWNLACVEGSYIAAVMLLLKTRSSDAGQLSADIEKYSKS